MQAQGPRTGPESRSRPPHPHPSAHRSLPTMADIPGQEGGQKIRCAVNGFGRVGRIVTRIAWKSDIIE